MKPFFTEKQTEEFLLSETRTLELPGGRIEVITANRLFWYSLDLMIEAYITTLDDLYRYTYMDMSAQNTSFADSFKAIVVYIDNRVK